MTNMDKIKAMSVEEFCNLICENPDKFIFDTLHKATKDIMEEIDPRVVFTKQNTMQCLESEVDNG